MSPIFRQQAWAHMSAPEQLDQLMRVVRPKHWLALLTCAGLALIAVFWSVFGHLPITVEGQGVLIHPHQVVYVQAAGAGRLTTLGVQVGNRVQVGTVLGTIEQAKIRQQLHEARTQLQKLQAQDEAKYHLQGEHTALQAQQATLTVQSLNLQRRALRKRLRDAQVKLPRLKERLEKRERLETLGVLPKNSEERLQAEQVYQDTEDTIAQIQTELQQLERDERQLQVEIKSLALQTMEASTSRQNQIQELRSQMALLEQQLAENSQIVSPYAGHILELMVHAGEVIESGQRLASIDVIASDSNLVGVTYFPIETGKKIVPGMPIHIAPDTVKRERFGSIIATVTTVSALPITKEGVASLVGNADVVEALVKQGPAIEVVADLALDTTTFSGYKWSSSTGPPLPITMGTTMVGRVVLEHRTPITYLLPMLREASGFY